ncbi:PDZ-binding protein [Phlyctochytrium arcticum]|nr:PDZ-binding protein [Phlyctochytrium arcticum]
MLVAYHSLTPRFPHFIGEKKLATLAAPDKWKDGSRNTNPNATKSTASSSSSSSSTTTTTRAINENKLLSAKKKFGIGSTSGGSTTSSKFNPYEARCKVCKQRVHQAGSRYCQICAYKNGICAICGVQILDTSGYRMASK